MKTVNSFAVCSHFYFKGLQPSLYMKSLIYFATCHLNKEPVMADRESCGMWLSDVTTFKIITNI